MSFKAVTFPAIFRTTARVVLGLACATFVSSSSLADETSPQSPIPAVEGLATGLAPEEMPLFAEEGEIVGLGTGCCGECSAGVDCDRCDRRWLSFRDRVTVGAEYLLLRPSFSNATALYETTTSTQGGFRLSQQAINHDFGYASGLRGFVGYRLSDDWMIRFGYTSIFANTSAVGGTSTGNWGGGNGTGFVGPYNTSALVAGQSIRSSLAADLALYDLELAGRLNPDRCGPASGGSRWEAAGAVGLRFADTSVNSNVVNDQTALGQGNLLLVDTSRGFQGVGPRLAIQGRRYLGAKARWSVFASGAAALLVGSSENIDVRTTVDSVSPNVQQQRAGGTLVVPNLDLSLGTTWQVTQRTSLSAGWLLMYFDDLGYSEQISTVVATTQPDLVPLTKSSLTYDGFFFRLTHNF